MVRLIRDLGPFVRRFRPQWRWMALGTGLGLVTVAASIGLMSLSGWFLSAAAFAGLSRETAHLFNFFYPSVGVRIFAFARTLGRYGDRVISHDATFRILENLRVWFYDRIEPLGPGPLGGFRSGDLLSRVISDIDALDNLYLRVIQPTVVALILLLALPAFLFPFDPRVSLAAFAGILAAAVGVPLVSGRLGAPIGREMAVRTAALRTRIVEGLQGAPELAVFDASGRYLDGLRKENRELIEDQHRMSRIQGTSVALTTLLSGLTVGAVLWLGAAAVSRQSMDGAVLALAAMAVLAAFEGVVPLPAAYQFMGRTREAAVRLTEIVQTEAAVAFPETTAHPPNGHDLVFENVTFRYTPGAPKALDRVSFHIPEGGRLAVLGETGAGKSTLANLLVRFWDPDEGRILVGGEEIHSFSEADLRRMITVVSQQVHLFNASIRDNLRLARADASEADMKAALSAASLLEEVERLPDGLDTWIGEGGRELSGGQARRLSVARALLHDAPIWVLDEPTEGLDTVTEAAMMAALYRHTRGRTLILITHRLPPCRMMLADAVQGGKAAPPAAVAVLDRGRFTAGPPQDLSF